MNFEFFIAKRLAFNKKNSLSYAFIKIAIISTALGIFVMILSVSILNGFKKNIRQKLSLFSGHIIVTKQDLNYSYELSPIEKNKNLEFFAKNIPEVLNIQAFAIKPGLVKTKNLTQGVVLKGIDKDFTWDIFKNNIVKGTILKISDDSVSKNALISETLAKDLNLNLNDYLFMYFLDNPPRLRKYKITGIYSTGMPEFDKYYILVDIKDVQKLYNWNSNQISGYEIILNDYKNIDKVYDQIFANFGIQFDENGNKLEIKKIFDIYPQIFSWLSILDINAIILIVIIFIVASVNMVTALLIIILDKARVIGILKALGASNFSIRKIFIFNGIHILLKGLFWGNLLTLIFSFLQIKFHIIPLNPQNYFISYVPLDLDIFWIIVLNLAVIIGTFIILFIPSIIVSKISPVKVVKFN